MVSDEIIEERAHQSLCSLDHHWSPENIKDKFVSWRSRLYLDPNPTWFDSEITQPLNPKLPTVNVSVRHFANRKDMSKTVFKITNMRGDLLLSGLAKNGVIFSDVPGEVASRSDWYDPVTITFSQYKAGYDTVNEEDDEAFFSVHGQLKDGKLQGFVVFKGTLSVDPFGHCPSTIFVGNGFVGKYNDGIPTGVCYLGLVGAAWVYGRVDDSGHFTGDDIAYIYPDMKTAFIGTFKKGIMISATETEVEAVRCPSTGILEVKFSPASKSPVYKYSPPNSNSFGDDPLKDDPLDNRYMYLKKSMAAVNAGEGMFAKVDIPEGTTIGVMSGLLFKEKYLAQPLAKSDEAIQSPNEFLNTSSGYRLDLIDCKVHIDIPPEYRSTENFRATLGHKINHSFEPNVKFTPMESPRFGVIISVYAIKNITKDEEILVNYKYKIDNAPVWYKQLHEEHLKNISSETSTVHN